MENDINRKKSFASEHAVNINLRNNSARSFQDARLQQNQEAVAPSTRVEEEKNNKFIIKVFNRLIGLSLFMLFFGVPLYFTGLASQGIIFEKQIYFYFWLLLGVVVWSAKGVISGELNIRRTPLDLPILGFWLAYGAAVVFSVDRWHSFWGAFSDPSRGFMSISAYIVAYYFIISNFNLGRLKLILGAFVSSGILVSIWTLLAIFNVTFLPSNIAAYAPFSLLGSVTSLGVFLSLFVPLTTVVILKLAENDKMTKLKKNISLSILLAFLALNLFLILAFYNYVPWLGLFAGVVIMLIFILAKIVRPLDSWTWLPMVVFVLVMIARMTGDVSVVKTNLPVEVSLNYPTSSSIAWESLKSNFLVGSGPATYGYDFSLYRPQDFNTNAFFNLRFSQGTGAIFELAPTVGGIGIFFFLILFLSYVGVQFYLLYKDKEKNKLYSLGVFSATAIVAVNIFSIRTDGAILSLGVLLGSLALATALFQSETKENNFNLSLKASPKYALALAFIFMVVSAGVAFFFVYLGRVYAADIYAGQASLKIAKDHDAAIYASSRAASLNPREARYYTQLGQYYMTLANQEASRGEQERDISKIQQYLNNSIAVSSQAKNISPTDVSIVESLALIYENAGLYVVDSLSLAEENYKKAQEFEPHNPIYYIKLGQIKIAMASMKESLDEKKKLVGEAKELFKKSTEEKNNYSNGYYQLTLAHEALDEFDQAIENGEKAVLYNSKNVNYLLTLGRIYQNRNAKDDMKTAEKIYKSIISLDGKTIDGHFYLGLLYEKTKNKDGAKDEYKKVISLIEENKSSQSDNNETISQLNKMIANVDRGVENTPESLGLIKKTAVEEPVAPIAEEATPQQNNALAPPEANTVPAEENQVLPVEEQPAQ